MLGQKAEQASKLPSECVPGLVEEIGEWGRWCFDNAVGWFMRVMQNALQERNVTGNESEPRYSLSLLLADDFHLPKPPAPRRGQSAGQGLRAIALSNPGIFTRWKQKQPGEMIQ
jgi:hypothetical protein